MKIIITVLICICCPKNFLCCHLKSRDFELSVYLLSLCLQHPLVVFTGKRP